MCVSEGPLRRRGLEVCGDSDPGPKIGHFEADKAVILGWIPRSFCGGRSGHFEPDSPVILEWLTQRLGDSSTRHFPF